MPSYEPWFLEAVLEGLELQRSRLDEQIAQLRSQLQSPRKRGRPPGSAARVGRPTGSSKKRILSAEARQRISAAQKKRWKAYHAQHASR